MGSGELNVFGTNAAVAHFGDFLPGGDVFGYTVGRLQALSFKHEGKEGEAIVKSKGAEGG